MAKQSKPKPAPQPDDRIDQVLDEAQAIQETPVVAEISPVAKPETYRVVFSPENSIGGVRRQNPHYGGGGEPRWDVVVAVVMGDDTEGFIIPSVPERLLVRE